MDRYKAIINTHPNVVTINGDKDAWDKDGNVVVLDESKIATEMERLQAEYDAQEYSRNRKEEYPSIPDQLDYIYHHGVEKWKADMILPVKEKYPKGAEQCQQLKVPQKISPSMLMGQVMTSFLSLTVRRKPP